MLVRRRCGHRRHAEHRKRCRPSDDPVPAAHRVPPAASGNSVFRANWRAIPHTHTTWTRLRAGLSPAPQPVLPYSPRGGGRDRRASGSRNSVVTSARQRARSASGRPLPLARPVPAPPTPRGRGLRDRPHRRLRPDRRPDRHQRAGTARRRPTVRAQEPPAAPEDRSLHHVRIRVPVWITSVARAWGYCLDCDIELGDVDRTDDIGL